MHSRPNRCRSRASWPDLLGSVWFLVGLAIVTVLLAYRLLPPKAPRWRSAAIPAIVVGLAVVALSQIFMFLVPRLVGVAALAGSIASAFVALAWLSFTFQAVLYGAAWVRVRDERPCAECRVRPGKSRSAGRTGRSPTMTVRS